MSEETINQKLNELVGVLTEVTDLELRNRLVRSALDNIKQLVPSSYDRVMMNRVRSRDD